MGSKRQRLTPAGRPVSVSVIIPALNEEGAIVRAIESAKAAKLDSEFVTLKEIIVVDGESSDDTVERARAAGAQVISCLKHRARQLNAGAAEASADYLVFLHADSVLPDEYGRLVHEACHGYQADTGQAAPWGCFETIQIDESGMRMNLLRWGVAARTKLLHLPYGDQCIFVATDVFRRHQGFQELDLMEDLDLVRRLNRHEGPPVIVPAPVQTSSRRWQKLGLLRTTLTNQVLILAWLCGIPESTLARWYRIGTGTQQQIKN
ncbi:hypothetical protein WJX73_009951 [Symbiochloris irregularis]|uniref:Glycosyltransferase 2-like domain-containing protein n=1 Tax=Symbiochloris irregularis TaxID=706552 RepID=A0AAW1PW47_9CHLO